MNVIMVFNTVTTAKRVEKTLANYGVLSKVIHTPKAIGAGGCSHSVYFNERYIESVKRIIYTSDVEIKGVYKELNCNGSYLYKEIDL